MGAEIHLSIALTAGETRRAHSKARNRLIRPNRPLRPSRSAIGAVYVFSVSPRLCNENRLYKALIDPV